MSTNLVKRSVLSSVTTSTDNSVPRWDGTTARRLQTTNVVIDDNNILTLSTPIQWSGGTAITAGTYQISRDADATNQLHFNVPTGTGFEFSINDVVQLNFNINGLQFTPLLESANSSGYRVSSAPTAANTATFTFRADSNTGIGTSAADTCNIVTGGTDRVLVNNNETNFTHGIKVARTTSAAGAYTVLVTDYIVGKTGITGGGDTVTLPAAATAGVGKVYIIKDESGTAATNNITVDGNAAETIDGSATIAISANYGVLRIYTNGSNWFSF